MIKSVARHGRCCAVRLGLWALAATTLLSSTDPAAAGSGESLVLRSGMRVPVPRNLSTSKGMTRTVRYELETTTEIIDEGGTTSFPNTGCTWISFRERVIAVRANEMDYASYSAREARQGKSATPYVSWTADGGETKQDLFVEHSWDATMRVRARDRRLACAASLDRSRDTAGGEDLVRTRVRESIVVNYGDGPPPRCGDSPRDPLGPSRPSILTRVPELEALAKKAAGGGLGCGHGTFTIITSRGPVRLRTGASIRFTCSANRSRRPISSPCSRRGLPRTGAADRDRCQAQ